MIFHIIYNFILSLYYLPFLVFYLYLKMDITEELIYYSNGNIKLKKLFKNNKLHNINDPAEIHYYQNGNIKLKKWFIYGDLHNFDQPSYIEYFDNAQIKTTRWYVHNKIHRDNNPAEINYFQDGNIKSLIWYNFNIIHNTNTNKPSYINYDEYINNIYDTKTETWYKLGKIHRINNPAIIVYNYNNTIISKGTSGSMMTGWSADTLIMKNNLWVKDLEAPNIINFENSTALWNAVVKDIDNQLGVQAPPLNFETVVANVTTIVLLNKTISEL
jgi:antitoxin component YwqK of YwqJK toxin-antitoxin module